MDAIDGEDQFYVGQSNDYEKRNERHFGDLMRGKGNYLFQRSFNLSNIKTLAEFTSRRCLLIAIPNVEITSDAVHALEVTAVEQKHIDWRGTNNVSKVAGCIERSLVVAAYSGILFFY